MGQTVNLLVFTFGGSNPSPPTAAAIAQLVEHDLAKVGVASSSLVCRSILRITKQLVKMGLLFLFINE